MNPNLNLTALLALLQTIVEPLVQSLGGPNIPHEVEKAGPYIAAAKRLLLEAAETLGAVETAVADGLLTEAEINAVIADAVDTAAAWTALKTLVAPPPAGPPIVPADPGAQPQAHTFDPTVPEPGVAPHPTDG